MSGKPLTGQVGPGTDFPPGAYWKIVFISNGFVRLSALAV
jgi:hypothetical protein